jgi:hypothetical protein
VRPDERAGNAPRLGIEGIQPHNQLTRRGVRDALPALK